MKLFSIICILPGFICVLVVAAIINERWKDEQQIVETDQEIKMHQIVYDLNKQTIQLQDQLIKIKQQDIELGKQWGKVPTGVMIPPQQRHIHSWMQIVDHRFDAVLGVYCKCGAHCQTSELVFSDFYSAGHISFTELPADLKKLYDTANKTDAELSIDKMLIKLHSMHEPPWP